MNSAWCLRARALSGRVLEALVLSAVIVSGACGRTEVAPEPLGAGEHACDFCRMTVSQPQFASQLLVPGELPRFFDDLGCLHGYLTGTTPGADGGVVFVTDHRTRDWVRAETAVFTRVSSLSTPMGSHLVAHATPASRDSDPLLTGGTPATIDDVVPTRWRSGQER